MLDLSHRYYLASDEKFYYSKPTCYYPVDYNRKAFKMCDNFDKAN